MGGDSFEGREESPKVVRQGKEIDDVDERVDKNDERGFEMVHDIKRVPEFSGGCYNELAVLPLDKLGVRA